MPKPTLFDAVVLGLLAALALLFVAAGLLVYLDATAPPPPAA